MEEKIQGCTCCAVREKLLDQSQVAEILGMSVRTLEYWRWNKGGPKYIKIGKLVRYRESDLYEFIDELVEGN